VIGLEHEMQSLRLAISKQPNTAENKKSRKPLKTKAFGAVCGAPEGTRIPDLPLRRSPRGAFLTPYKSPKILDFTGFSGISLLVNSRPKPANFSWFFAFLLAGY